MNTGIKTRGELSAVLWSNSISLSMHISSLFIQLRIIWLLYSTYADSALFNNPENSYREYQTTKEWMKKTYQQKILIRTYNTKKFAFQPAPEGSLWSHQITKRQRATYYLAEQECKIEQVKKAYIFHNDCEWRIKPFVRRGKKFTTQFRPAINQ